VSAVKQALVKLNDVVGNLESSLDNLEANRTGEQRDMFGGPAVNVNVVAQKLDNAIEGLEGVLQEGRG